MYNCSILRFLIVRADYYPAVACPLLPFFLDAPMRSADTKYKPESKHSNEVLGDSCESIN